jgi:chromosome segregation ATPase
VLERERDSLTSRVEKLQASKSDLEEKLRQSTQQNNALEREKDNLTSKLEKLSSAKSDLVEKLASLTHEKDDIVEKFEQLITIRGDLEGKLASERESTKAKFEKVAIWKLEMEEKLRQSTELASIQRILYRALYHIVFQILLEIQCSDCSRR